MGEEYSYDNGESEGREVSYEPPSDNRYEYRWFRSGESPEGELLARKIQAESYVAMGIARVESLVTLTDGTRIMTSEGSNPSGSLPQAPDGSFTEYALGVEKGTSDMSPLTGRLVAWRKFYTPRLDDLPAYQFLGNGLWPEGEHDLRRAEADPNLVLTEPEGLGKTVNAGSAVVREFMRNEIQRALGRGEVWFMGLVEGTAYESFVHNWGTAAVRQIGEPRVIENQWICEGVALVPTIMDVDNFYANMASDILKPRNKLVAKQLANFVYMTEGVSDGVLGPRLAEFREWARSVIVELGGSDE